jgi:two-component system, chemotaxis family, protein-glutamate methylesterase/glutaminase
MKDLGGIEAVVIGASAGGVEALGLLLPTLHRRQRAAVLVVLHQPRDRPSLLVEVFAPRCALAVREAEDREPITAGTIYFAPPDYHLLVDAGPRIALSLEAPLHFSRPAIDALFESAAEVWGRRLLAILLTGANADGAAGIARVAQAGGTTVVQLPADARHPVMPESALATHPDVDHVLPLPGIAALLATLRTH